MSEQVAEISGRRLRLRNLDKVMYPATGTTKGEVIDYYVRIATALIPQVQGRPITRKRWVDGVGTTSQPGTAFFRKELESAAPGLGAPGALQPPPRHHHLSDGRRARGAGLVRSAGGLGTPRPAVAVRRGGETFEPGPVRVGPGSRAGAGLAECAQVALIRREFLDETGLATVPVTSGSKGIHLYAQLDGTTTSEQAADLAKELARAIEADHPDLVLSRMGKALRDG